MTSLLPIFLDLKGKSVLVVGGGFAALEKLEKLVVTGANIEVIAKTYRQETLQFIRKHQLPAEQRSFQEKDLNGRFVVISAVNHRQSHQQIAKLAREKGILINSVDEKSASDFYFAAQIARGPLQIAISTQGQFPGLARSIRLWLEEQFPAEIAHELYQLADIRQGLRKTIPDSTRRMEALRQQLETWMATSSLALEKINERN